MNPGQKPDVRNIGHVFCNFVDALSSGGTRSRDTIDVKLRLTLERSKIHVRATSSHGHDFGKVEIDRFR